MEFTPLYLSLKLNLFISKSRNELLLPRPIGRFPPESKREMAPSLSSSLVRPLFSWRLMRSTSMRGIRRREIDSIRERERRERNLEISFPFSRSPMLASFLVPVERLGKVKAKPPRRNSICRDGKQLSTSVLFRFSFSPAISIAITKSIYHDARIARQKYATFKPLSRLRAPFFISLEQFSFNPCAAR